MVGVTNKLVGLVAREIRVSKVKVESERVKVKVESESERVKVKVESESERGLPSLDYFTKRLSEKFNISNYNNQ